MAQKKVVRSNGEIVIVKLWRVDRKRQRVGFDIPQYNARIIFTNDAWGRPSIISENDRQKLEKDKEATTHVSESVYAEMAAWAGSILCSKRREGERHD